MPEWHPHKIKITLTLGKRYSSLLAKNSVVGSQGYGAATAMDDFLRPLNEWLDEQMYGRYFVCAESYDQVLRNVEEARVGSMLVDAIQEPYILFDRLADATLFRMYWSDDYEMTMGYD